MMTSSIICILGMHRSGTSLTTRLINLLGVHVGPQERLVKAATPNPKGFWEHRRLLRVNNQILWRLGGHSHDPPVFPLGWEDSVEFDDLRQRARDIIEEDFAASELWGWKDPRTCLTLPFWQRLLPPMRYVICMRHPTAVAQSLIHRDGLSLVESLNLWLVYLRSALSHTDAQQRILMFYDEIIDDWHPQLQRLAHFVGSPDLAEDPAVREAAVEFIDANLRHHRTRPSEAYGGFDLDSSTPLLDLVERVYRNLERERESFGQPEMESTLDAALDLVRLERVHHL